jgi:hypothetical protein
LGEPTTATLLIHIYKNGKQGRTYLKCSLNSVLELTTQKITNGGVSTISVSRICVVDDEPLTKRMRAIPAISQTPSGSLIAAA